MILRLPLPNLFNESLASERVPIAFFFGQSPLHNVLRGDSRVVGAGHPHGLKTVHALVADEDVLNRVVEGVPDVQHAGHVGRRYHNAVLRLGRRRIGVEVAFLKPVGVEAVFYRGRVVLFFHNLYLLYFYKILFLNTDIIALENNNNVFQQII